MNTPLSDAAAASPREYLDSLAMHGIKLGLTNIEYLLECAGRPERAYPSVHVAGTNGKGSVVAILGAMLIAAGYRAGRFTSPHLVDLRERFLINGETISEAALEENINCFRHYAAALEMPPTFFELNTAVAFRWFQQQHVDIALVEVGLGGRLDSTNVLRPDACAITNIDLEHTEYLGGTLEKIAWEKAGIIKPGVPVVIGERKPGPRDVLVAQARERKAPARFLDQDFRHSLRGQPWAQQFSYESDTLCLNDVPLGLHGRYQGENAALAVALAEQLRGAFPRLTPQTIVHGLAHARWPGRMEKVLDQPPVIMDVAHNAAGARRLAETLPQCVVVFAASADKDVAGMLQALAGIARPLILTTFTSHRATPIESLKTMAGDIPITAVEDLRDALEQGLMLASDTCPLLITGSIYMAGEARQILIERHGARPVQF